MRTIACTAVIAAAILASASDRQGVYQPKGAQPVQWSVNANHALIWGGSPYIPRGVRIPCSLDEVRQAKALGFKDVVVELPLMAEPPNEVFAELDKLGMTYMIALDCLAPAAPGFAVEPQGYRVDGIVGSRHVEFPIVGSHSALALFVFKRDASIDWSKRVAIDNDRFSMDVDAANQVERVLLVYPQVVSIAQPDYWQDFDRHRDQLLAMLRRGVFGHGFRGLIDPLGRALHLEYLENKFVPSSMYFQAELSSYLEKEYKSIETAQKAWSMSTSDIESFDQMGRLVPLWSGLRGVSEAGIRPPTSYMNASPNTRGPGRTSHRLWRWPPSGAIKASRRRFAKSSTCPSFRNGQDGLRHTARGDRVSPA